MSIICGVCKNNQTAISADTLSTCGSLTVSAGHRVNSSKLLQVNGSIIGIVGWSAVADIIEHLSLQKAELFQLDSRMDIFSTLLRLHKEMKETYFLETDEDEAEQPVESNQLTALIINRNGLFGTESYRAVDQYTTYWAVGSGNRLALGAMHALYNRDFTAREIAEAGVLAAAEFDDGCGLPLQTEVIS